MGTVWARSRLGSCLSSASRIRVSHKRGPAAENVEVLITRLWRVEDSRAELVESFLPLSLRWANRTPPTATERVPKGLFRHCDVCAFASTQVGETWVQFTTLVQPNPVGNIGYPNVLQAGDYEFELKMSGDNLQPVTKRWALSFDSSWSNDAATSSGAFASARSRAGHADSEPLAHAASRGSYGILGAAAGAASMSLLLALTYRVRFVRQAVMTFVYRITGK